MSRLQRDLTDSTVIRNIGIPLSHTLIALQSLEKGLEKLLLNESKIKADLEDNWPVVAEAIQTILRREQVEGAYELLRDLTRTNKQIDQKSMSDFINNLPVSETIKAELRQFSPYSYTGIDLLKQNL